MEEKGPERTCISCRRKAGKDELLKLVNSPSGVVIDYNWKLPGRGAYICAEKKCIEKGASQGALSRAFKGKAQGMDADEFMGQLCEKINRKVGSLLGMARKSGGILMGFEAAVLAASRNPGGLMVLAEDLSDNTRRKVLETVKAEDSKTVYYSTKAALGEALGASPVGVVYIKKPALAAALDREIRRLINICGG